VSEHAHPALPDWPGRMPAPVFVVGSMGSGSTLTRLILDSHRHIAIGQETSFMRLITAHRWVPFWRFGDKWFGRLELTAEELDEELVRFYSGLFERFARRHGKQRWGEKTPHHVWHMSEMARLFPDAAFVGIVRHPGGTTGSLVGRFKFEPRPALHHWLRMNNEMVEQGSRLGDRFVLMRYEDLVLKPENTLRELLDWLDEPWDPEVLRHHEIQRRKGAPEVVDGRTLSGDAIDESRVAKWMTSFGDAEREMFRTEAGAWASFFGYDVDTPQPVDDLVPASSQYEHLITGDELAKRRESFRDRVDFTPPPRPAVEGIHKHPKAAKPSANVSPRHRVLRALIRRLPPPLRRTVRAFRRRQRERRLRSR
jgi:hypothetical protein